MAKSTRRRFIATTSAGAIASIPLSALFSSRALARDYGPLVPDPDGLLDLPEGFSYRIVEEVGDPMDDGFEVPSALDGMACFDPGDGTLVLLRNHEITGANGNEPDTVYTANSGGGVTRVVVDATTGERISSNWVLAGTRRNCAGGPSPWGWLTCEENVDTDHGYVFLTAVDAEEAQPPDRKVGYGRYNHEAVAIDPDTLYAYLTEDRGDGCLYRFVPDDAQADPFTGTLQALRVTSEDVFPTEDMVGGDSETIDWVDVDEPDPAGDTVRFEAQGAGAANVRRGEGIWYWDGAVYIASTSGGPGGLGQIFRLTDDGDTGTLECLVASASAAEMISPDNVAVSPWGQVVICEDADVNCHIRVITEDGDVAPFAQNVFSQSELAGVCFSPDGTILFVNSQSDGITYAVTGPFPEVPDPPAGTGTGGTGDQTGDVDPDDTSDDVDPDDTAADGSGDGDEQGNSSGASAGTTSSDEQTGGSGSGGSGGGTGDPDGCGCQQGSTPGGVALAAAATLALKRRAQPDD